MSKDGHGMVDLDPTNAAHKKHTGQTSYVWAMSGLFYDFLLRLSIRYNITIKQTYWVAADAESAADVIVNL